MALIYHSNEDDPLEWEQELKTLMPSIDFRVWPDTGNVDEIDIALVWRAPPGMLASLPKLELLLSLGVGVDHLLSDPDLPDVPITRLVDDFCTTAMTEYVLLQVLRFHRQDPLYQSQQRAHEWTFHAPRIASQRRVGIMGIGTLGAHAAAKLGAIGFEVSGWSKHAKRIEGVRCYAGDQELAAFLAETEILVCLLALTPETESILDQQAFDMLPRGAYVINAARGGHLVEADLLAAIDSGHIAGAALDCFATEPLPHDSPIWAHPGIFVTPHAATGTHAPSAARHVAENIRRFYAGEPLMNVLDRGAGY